jgi:TonB family protein
MKTLTAACLAMLLLAGHAASDAQERAPTPLDAAGQYKSTLEELDKLISSLREAHWMLPEMMGNPPPDASGRRPQDDLAEYLLTDESLGKITALREDLGKQAAAGAPVATGFADPLPALLQAEMCRLMMVTTYWSGRKVRDFHQDLIQQLVARLPEAERGAATRETTAIEARSSAPRPALVEAIRRCGNLKPGSMFQGESDAPALLADAAAELDGYNTLRQKLATRLDAVRIAAAPDGGSVHRSIPCPPPAPAPIATGKRGATIRSQPDLRDYFPADAINFKVMGKARLRMVYDNTGCITDVAILESTGAEILDAAAMRIAFDYALVPAQEDGKAVGGGVVLPVNFNILDVDMTREPATQPQP